LIGSVYFIHKENATFCLGDLVPAIQRSDRLPRIKDDSIGQHPGEVNKIGLLAQAGPPSGQDKYTPIQKRRVSPSIFPPEGEEELLRKGDCIDGKRDGMMESIL
jgi:hypothetical protein